MPMHKPKRIENIYACKTHTNIHSMYSLFIIIHNSLKVETTQMSIS